MRKMVQRTFVTVGGTSLLVFAALLGAAHAQEETKADTGSKPAVAVNSEANATARQQMVRRLRRLGVNLDWHKATLAELKQTMADLVGAGDDEDARLRIVLAARLREFGVHVNWHRLTAEELTDRYTDAMQDAKQRKAESAAASPASEEATESVAIEGPALPRVQETPEMTAARLEALALSHQQPPTIIVQPAPVIVQEPVYTDPSYGTIYLSNGYTCAPGTYYTPNGLTIVNNGYPYHHGHHEGNDYNIDLRYHPPVNLPPATVQTPINMPGGRPGVPGVIPIQHPKIPWLNGDKDKKAP